MLLAWSYSSDRVAGWQGPTSLGYGDLHAGGWVGTVMGMTTNSGRMMTTRLAHPLWMPADESFWGRLQTYTAEECSWEWLSKQTSLLKINCFLDGLGSPGQDGMRPFLGIVMIVRVGGANLFRMQAFKLALGPFTWIVGHVEKAAGVDFRFYRFLLWNGSRCERHLV